jgi:DNA-binding NtrC family response regulator
VDDEASQRSGLATLVSAWGMLPETAGDGNEALLKLADFPADVILTDLNMPGLDGFGLLRRLRDSGDMPPAIVLTAFGNIETAVKTVHELGAYWFLEKPIQPGVLETLVRRAGSHAGLRAEKRNLERQLGYKGSLGELVGASAKMQEIFALLQQAGPSKACVLITGESGVGKELVARALHLLSPRRQGPFIAINCAALPETLIESELFGHEKGSFTGAFERRAGCFEAAQGGTLPLDEIGEMPMQTQAKLLRILEDSRVRRLGGKAEFEVDVPPESPAEDDPDCIKFRVGATVEEAEKGLILVTLEHTRNNKTRAAEILGISLKTLHNKLKEYGAG